MILDKLDGSMIHPCMIGGQMTFMTRAGVTPQSLAALDCADAATLRLCAETVDAGMTAMFEFTAPEHRIDIAYDRPALTLLAVRENVSGRYLAHAEVTDLAARHGVAAVTAIATGRGIDDLVDTARKATGSRAT